MRIRLQVRTGVGGRGARTVTVTTPQRCAPEDLHADRIAGLLAATLGTPGDALAVRDRLLDPTTPLGSPPLLDGASVRLVQRAHWSPPTRTPRYAASELAVISGPCAGVTRPLTAGTHTVGRAGADLTVADPSLSRLHLRLDVAPDGITLTELGSQNGTTLDGHRVGEAPVPLPTNALIRAGRSTLAVRPSRILPLATRPRGDGTLAVSRSTTPVPPVPRSTITVPAPPPEPVRRRVPWVAALAPVPIALLLAAFFGPHLLLFALMSPLLVLGNVVSDRIGTRRTYAQDTRTHLLAIEQCQGERSAALTAERVWREATFPDLCLTARTARTPGARLWSRSVTAGGLTVRLGRGDVESGVTWNEAGASRPLILEDAPLVTDLEQVGSLCVTGPLAGSVTDAILGQLLTLCSPAELQVHTDRVQWAGAPHARVGTSGQVLTAALAALDTNNTADATDDRSPLRRVIVISAATLGSADLAALSTLCREGPERGIVTIVTDQSVTASRATLETTATGAALLHLPPHHQPHEIVVDAVPPDWVEAVAAALTPLRDGSGDTMTLPDAVALVDLLGNHDRDNHDRNNHDQDNHAPHEAPTPQTVRRRWETADDGAWTTLGGDAQGPCRLDLATAGPHALVGGTTGSGKSELLRTLVVSLAVEHPPEDLSVVLVDYKGGSAFAGLESLPHIVGVVTDLDPALTRRALRSLRAEIHRREELFARAGVSDIVGYRSRSRSAASTDPTATGDPLPHLRRLVIVVDEFRALADELPDFVTGLVRLAAVGRSLGLHLVLATQRPAGVVSADMRANLNLRIALRVRDRSDSQDVIDADDAARLPRTTPGRALLRCGSDPLRAVQVATVSVPDQRATTTAEVTWTDGTTLVRELASTRHDGGPPDPVALITAAAAGHHRAPSPWLPPLPPTRPLHADDPAAAWALVDEPDRQRQELAILDLGSLPITAVGGEVGSGRSTTALTMALAAVAGEPTTHLYALADPTGPLASLAALAHTGAVVDRADPAAVAWFVDRLAAEVGERQRERRGAYLLVVIDGWDVLADACDQLDHGALTDRLLAVLREGHALGIRALLTGDRSVLSGRVGRTVQERLLLRTSEQTDLLMVGLRRAELPTHWPNGRLVRAADGVEHQVLLRTVDDRPLPPPTTLPWRLTSLPATVTLDEIDEGTTDLIPVGLSGEDGRTVVIGVPGRRRVLVLGSPGSGRTSTLATIALAAAHAGRPVCAVAEPHSELARLTGGIAEQIDWHDLDHLVRLRRAHPDLVVVVDDVGRHLEAPVSTALEQIADLVERDGGLIAVCAEASGLGLRTRGAAAAVARGRAAIVLGSPTTLESDAVGTRLPRVREVIPGRGWLCVDRTATPIQVALPQHDPSNDMTGVIPTS